MNLETQRMPGTGFPFLAFLELAEQGRFDEIPGFNYACFNLIKCNRNIPDAAKLKMYMEYPHYHVKSLSWKGRRA